jgi:hypothetical protein
MRVPIMEIFKLGSRSDLVGVSALFYSGIVRSNNIAFDGIVCPSGRVTRSSSIFSGDSRYSTRLP